MGRENSDVGWDSVKQCYGGGYWGRENNNNVGWDGVKQCTGVYLRREKNDVGWDRLSCVLVMVAGTWRRGKQ